MFVGVARIELHIPASGSLKGKRTVVKGLIGGLTAKFNVAAAEVDHLQLWQRTALGISCVSGQIDHVRKMLQEVERFVARESRVEILSTDVEIFQPED
ncbi:MAG TPA: DUF503 domain-containing protein [Actinomycetota bacterium]|nr:DUF503 domain-containing protein [Actinomycetota bacterium]